MRTAVAEPAAPAVDQAIGIQGEGSPRRDVDNRGAAAVPTTQQRTLATERSTAVRWNRYGTPATLVPRTDTQRRAATTSDPVAIARGFLADNRAAFGVSDQSINSMDVLLSRPMGEGSYVMLRQRFGDLPSTLDGLAAFGIRDGAVEFATSTISPDRPAPEPATLSPEAALAAASADAGLSAAQLASTHVSLGAVPMPDGAPRAAYQVVLQSNDLVADFTAFTTYIDARTGQVLVREDIVDHETDNPEWSAFPANPPADYSSRDNRVTWCLTQAPGCERAVSSANDGLAWDVNRATGTSTLTSVGNSARNTEKWDSLAGGTVGTRTSAASPARDYRYAWTNQWLEAKCNPEVFATPQQNDIDAAIANLFVQHNRMHDWAYHLGFTEEAWNMQISNGSHGALGADPEQGQAQSGGRAGGAPPAFPSRDNANQSSPPDGVPPVTNMYLWQPLPGAFYAPCVDGDYDMSVIGHEYTHAISGRMIAGPNSGWSGQQAGSMNESTSDQFAFEYLQEYGFRPRGDTPFVTGGYVTGNAKVGIRDYDMSRSPLNYSNFAFDLTGPEVHADGEIWNAIGMDLRQAMVDKYGEGTPAQLRACADGAVPVERCPGGRRWVQLMFDALLLNASGAVSFVDMRDSILAADQIRFGGADLEPLWLAFARRGVGRDAASNGTADVDPTPSFASPMARNATLRLLPAGQAAGAAVRLYVGDYEARSVPVADTDPATPLPDTVELAPGSYHFLVAGAGFGSTRLERRVFAGERGVLPAILFRNVASAASGATATGDGVNLDKLIDDTEATDWASVGSPVAGKSVTVALPGRVQVVTRVQFSALLRPAIAGDADPGAQSRFTALRQFEVLSCNAVFGQDCANPASFRHVYTSPADAFPAGVPRPVAPDLIARSFRIPPTIATHLMVRVLTNQCTGTPAYAGQQHNDPRSISDCTTGNPAVAQAVRIAEFQAFIL
ncbi:MAG TPA: M36 family metallopeptidase [Actinophytocola sp.]|nr:M36 family metallopeptidase [Actinophytocola sp.]